MKITRMPNRKIEDLPAPKQVLFHSDNGLKVVENVDGSISIFPSESFETEEEAEEAAKKHIKYLIDNHLI